MFPSLSKCVPAALVRSTFTATESLSITSTNTSIQFFVNNVEVQSPFSVLAGDLVSAQISAPQNYSSVSYFGYAIDQSECQFAVVTEHEIIPSFSSDGSKKRWYDFNISDEHFVSYYDGTYNDVRSLGYNTRPLNPLEVKKDSIIVDHGPNNFILQQFDRVSIVQEPQLESWSASFDGNNFIRIDTSDDLTFGSGDFTIELKVKLLPSVKKQSIITNYSKFNKNNWFNFYIDENSRVIFSCTDISSSSPTESKVEGIQQLLTDEWYSLCVTRESGNLRIFVNGILEASGTVLTQIQKGFTYIGHILYDDSFEKYRGKMRQFRICTEAVYTNDYVVSGDLIDITPTTELLIFQDDPDYDMNVNVVPDPKTKTVYFYDIYGHLLDNVSLPVKPTQVEKFITAEKIFFMVSCSDRSIYMITITRDAYRKITLESNRDAFQLDWLFELPFETDIPFRGSFLSYARFKRAQSERDKPNCISVANGKIWVGGYSRIWKLDKNFNVEDAFTVPRLVVSIQSLGDSCIAVMSNGQIRYIDGNTRTSVSIYSGSWLGNLTKFNGAVYIADSIRKKLVKIDVTDPTAPPVLVDVGNFCPSYISANNSNLYIAGHDTNIVLKMNADEEFERIHFSEKVTWISAINQYFFASHYLKDVRILKVPYYASLIPFDVPLINCGIATVSTPPQKIRSIGAETAVPLLPLGIQDLTWWVDGKQIASVSDGSHFSVSAKFTESNLVQYPIVIGDIAFDFKVKSQVDNYIPRNIDFPTIISNKDQVQIDFTLPSNFGSAYASIDFGEIQKNFNTYVGQSKFTNGDMFTLKFAFSEPAINLVSLMTVGARNFYVPINAEDTETTSVTISGLPRHAYMSESLYIDTSGEYYIPYYDESFKQVNIPTSLKTIVNLGGQFSEGESISRLNDDDTTTNATVTAQNGLFDIYVDMEYAFIINGILLYNNTLPVDISRQPNVIYIEPPPPDFRFVSVPVNFRILATNDPTTSWNLIAEFNDIPNGENDWVQGFNEFNFSNTTPYRYWRFENTTTQNRGVSIAELVFNAFIPGISVKLDGTVLYTGKQNILEGQVLQVSMPASAKLGDENRFIIAGAKNYELKLKTKSINSVDYINVGAIASDIQRSTHYFHNISLTGTSIPVKLVSPNEYLKFSIDGGKTYSQTITINPITQKLSISKKLTFLDETNAVFYQELQDAFYGETYLAEIGKVTISQPDLEAAENNTDQRKNNVYIDDALGAEYEQFEKYSADGLLSAIEYFSVYDPENPLADNIIPSPINVTIVAGLIFRTRRNYPSAFLSNRILSRVEKNNMDSSIYGGSIFTPYSNGLSIANDYIFDIIGDVHIANRWNSARAYIQPVYHVRFLSTIYYPQNLIATSYLLALLHQTNLMMPRYPSAMVDLKFVYDDRYPTAIPNLTSIYYDRYPTALVDITSVFQSPYPSALLSINTQYNDSFDYSKFTGNYSDADKLQCVHLKIRVDEILRMDATVFKTITLINIDRLISNIEKRQYKTINKFSFYDGLPLVFLFNETAFYGFYDTEEQARIAAVNARHLPFMVYQVPSSSKYTYRRIFTLDNDCSIFPPPTGRKARERLIQGG